MNHTIENELLCIEIADHGAELVRIYDKEKGRDVLWEGDPAWWGRHAPVLFPHVGKHAQNEFRVHGRVYPAGQHGFARDMEFACVESTPDSVTHLLVSSDQTRGSYPFDFELKIRHVLTGKVLEIHWEVKNSGQEPMYFSIGGHPAFRLPDGQMAKCQLCFEGKQSLRYLLLDPAGSGLVLPGEVHILQLDDGKVYLDALRDGSEVLSEHMFDRDALIFDDCQFEKVRLLLPGGEPYLEMEAPDFPNFGIWSKPGAPFVCLEPWAGRTDDLGFCGELSEKPGINALGQGAVYQKSYSIRLF